MQGGANKRVCFNTGLASVVKTEFVIKKRK